VHGLPSSAKKELLEFRFSRILLQRLLLPKQLHLAAPLCGRQTSWAGSWAIVLSSSVFPIDGGLNAHGTLNQVGSCHTHQRKPNFPACQTISSDRRQNTWKFHEIASAVRLRVTGSRRSVPLTLPFQSVNSKSLTTGPLSAAIVISRVVARLNFSGRYCSCGISVPRGSPLSSPRTNPLLPGPVRTR